jgi:hypothetical protein
MHCIRSFPIYFSVQRTPSEKRKILEMTTRIRFPVYLSELNIKVKLFKN